MHLKSGPPYNEGKAHMQKTPEFLQAFGKEGEALIQKGFVKEPLFSQNTYQFKIQEGKKKKAFSPLSKSPMRGCSAMPFAPANNLNMGRVVLIWQLLTSPFITTILNLSTF